MVHSPSVELSRQEAMTLIRIANEGDIGVDDDGTVTRLQSLGLVEQRVLDPQHVLGPKGLQVQVEGWGPYLGFLASMSLSGRKLLFTDNGHSATFRAKEMSRILLNEFDAIVYDQVPNPMASEVQSARPPAR